MVQFLGGFGAPIEDYNPGEDLQNKGNGGQQHNGGDVGVLPFVSRKQYVEAFEDVHSTQDYDKVSNSVVVHVPVDPVLVLLVRPQQQRKHLNQLEGLH